MDKRILPRLLSAASTALIWLAVAMLVALTVLVIAQVVCRNAFDLGLPWADELSRFCGVALVFLAMPRLLLDDKHIAMDLVPMALPSRGRRALGILAGLLTIGFSALMLWAFYAFLARAGRFGTPVLGIPNTLYDLPAVLGFVFFAAAALYRLFAPHRPGMPPREPDA